MFSLFTCTPMRARIVLFLEFQHTIDPSIRYHISTRHAHIYQNYTSHPRTVALLGCQLPRRRHAATISAQIYYTPTLDSVIVCGHRPRTGWSHSQQQIEYALRFYSFYRRANRERTYKFHLHPTFEVCQRGSYFSFLARPF